MKELITEIQSLGIRVSGSITGRCGGAGPAEGRAFVIGATATNAPINAPYTKRSPFVLKNGGNGRLILFKNGEPIAPVSLVPEPHFYNLMGSDGIDYRKIALLHGMDCLATTVLQRCFNWRISRGCAFCGTEISLGAGATIVRKRPSQLAEVAMAAMKQDTVSHVVLTSGIADPPGTEILYLARCAAAIKALTDLPIQVQFSPPPDLSLMDELKTSGVDSVGIHVESFDADTLKRVAPAKSDIGLKRYEAAWKRAVSLFGPNQVSSFLIVGLGEPPSSVVAGSEVLADLGVYPFVVPLRPIPGSKMAHKRPPEPGVMKNIYEAVADVLQKKGLSHLKCKAGCVRCGACSALPLYEKPAGHLVCHSTRTEDEKSRAFAIRNEVFVKEQHIFNDSDIDEYDVFSTHLVAEINNEIVGTVRVFPAGVNGHWIGGRLAVRKSHRVYRVGATLVKEAMKWVKKKGGNKFTAHIQDKNIDFFKRLGWEPIGSMETYCDRPHQLMQADLNQVPEDY
jgi:radical SAM protein (TIGR04043 family)/putative N-acetyltransferase (TIGR04045 family)